MLGYTNTSGEHNGYLYVPTKKYLLAERKYLINYYLRTYMTREKMKEDNITESDKKRYIEKFWWSWKNLSTYPPLPRVFIGGKNKRKHTRRTRNKRRKLRTRHVRRVRRTRNKRKSRHRRKTRK
jgi:hypothetical protein